MEQIDKTRRMFLIGTIILGVLIVAGLVWAVASGPNVTPTGGRGVEIDPNIVFNDDGNPSVGPDNAKVTVRIYSDFECPACKIAEPALRQTIDAYKDRVKFVWNDFPLTELHANARSAAVAARCTQEQGNFWDYAHRLYDLQEAWTKLPSPNEYFISLAKDLGLMQDRFAKCQFSDLALSKVKQDVQEAQSMGLDSTPTFFIGRIRYDGVIQGAEWKNALDVQLK